MIITLLIACAALTLRHRRSILSELFYRLQKRNFIGWGIYARTLLALRHPGFHFSRPVYGVAHFWKQHSSSDRLAILHAKPCGQRQLLF